MRDRVAVQAGRLPVPKMARAPCGPALQLEPPEAQCPQAGQQAQRRSDGGRSVRADAVSAAKTEESCMVLGAVGGRDGGGMRRGVWRGLAGPRLRGHAWGSKALESENEIERASNR